MLLCHGVYGYQHQLGTGPELQMGHTTHAMPMGVHHTPSKEDGKSHHAVVNGGYFAVMISVLLLTAILWPWLGSFRIPAIRGARRYARQAVAPPVPHPPRGPTLYLFQVIRL